VGVGVGVGVVVCVDEGVDVGVCVSARVCVCMCMCMCLCTFVYLSVCVSGKCTRLGERRALLHRATKYKFSKVKSLFNFTEFNDYRADLEELSLFPFAWQHCGTVRGE